MRRFVDESLAPSDNEVSDVARDIRATRRHRPPGKEPRLRLLDDPITGDRDSEVARAVSPGRARDRGTRSRTR
jgi:hypothetical protein